MRKRRAPKAPPQRVYQRYHEVISFKFNQHHKHYLLSYKGQVVQKWHDYECSYTRSDDWVSTVYRVLCFLLDDDGKLPHVYAISGAKDGLSEGGLPPDDADSFLPFRFLSSRQKAQALAERLVDLPPRLQALLSYEALHSDSSADDRKPPNVFRDLHAETQIGLYLLAMLPQPSEGNAQR
jgi:hypothetical protein